MSNRLRVAVLVSGRGSNLQALLDAAREPAFPAEIVLVLSNKPDAYALERAHAAGVATETVEHRAFPTREAFDDAMHQKLLDHEVEFVCLAGFMRILSAAFVARWEGRMVNIHPSLLPEFRGLDTHKRAIEAGVAEHGCSIHWVTAGLDEGPVIAQARVPVLAGDTPETLAARVLVEENSLYPEVLRKLAS